MQLISKFATRLAATTLSLMICIRWQDEGLSMRRNAWLFVVVERRLRERQDFMTNLSVSLGTLQGWMGTLHSSCQIAWLLEPSRQPPRRQTVGLSQHDI
jgi:hypothetical protein